MSAAPTSSSPSRADPLGRDGRPDRLPSSTALSTHGAAPGVQGQHAAAVPAGHPTPPPNCSSCGSAPRLGTTRDIWPSVYDGLPMWLCAGFPACDCYVSCHPGSSDPMGLLAGPQLRQMRKRLHQLIDPLWQSEGISRTVVYQALSDVMGAADFHMGWADEAACKLLFARIPTVRQRAEALDDELHRVETGYHARHPLPAAPAAGQHASQHPGASAATASQDLALDLLDALAHDSRGQRRLSIPATEVERLGAAGKTVIALGAELGWIYPDADQTGDWRVTDAGWHALQAV